MANGTVKREVRTFGTTTKDLLALSEGLARQECTHIAMEATGVYWKPVWHVLSDGDFSLVLANAGHVKNVPGRKTDVNDATWLADLMAHGLIRGSFVPDAQTQELRGLLRKAGREELRLALQAEAEAVTSAATSPEGREGVAAFLQRRRPDFRAVAPPS